ncbi:MAG: hypothetical protein ABJA64_03055 [Candidatus Saccharibacteria bacterium]
MLGRQKQAGDTIIEVLFAITVFSLLAVGAIAIMNQGTITAQRALEVTLVRQQVDAQVEAIRYLQQQYSDDLASGSTSSSDSQWSEMLKPEHVESESSAFGVTDDGKCQPIPDKAFVLNARTATVSTVQPKVSGGDADSTPFAQVRYTDTPTANTVQSAYGIWVEAVKSVPSQKYVDFHIRACWYGPGSGSPLTLGTIVRLYAAN